MLKSNYLLIISNINNNDIMTVRSYIKVDSGLETEMLDDEEIITAVQDASSDDDAEEDVSPLISNKIALESIQILCNYLEQNNNKDIDNSSWD